MSLLDRTRSIARASWPWLRIPFWICMGLLFGFVLDGSASLACRGPQALGAGDAFVIPAGQGWALSDCSRDFVLLVVAVARDA